MSEVKVEGVAISGFGKQFRAGLGWSEVDVERTAVDRAAFVPVQPLHSGRARVDSSMCCSPASY
jgi:hypothetical protein